MPSKKRKTAVEAGKTAELNVPKELLDELVKGPMTQGDLETMFRSLKKAVIERAMSAEMSDHLGYAPGDEKLEDQSNHRNGASAKTVITDEGPLRIEVPRDREGSFEPLLIGKHERRFTGGIRTLRRRRCTSSGGDGQRYGGNLATWVATSLLPKWRSQHRRTSSIHDGKRINAHIRSYPVLLAC